MTEVRRTFDILERALHEFPREDAICGKRRGEWYTYSTETYYRKTDQFALGLLALGLKKGEKVATITTNRPEWNFADMGMSMTGIVHVPIYPNIGDEEYRHILEHSDARYVIVGDKRLYNTILPIVNEIDLIADVFTFEEVEGARHYTEIIDLGEEKRDQFATQLDRLKQEVDPDDVATIIYTSGTTGIPKGVMLTHTNLVSNVLAHAKVHPFGPGYKAISFLPLCHTIERSINYNFQYKGIGIFYIGSLAGIVPAMKEVKPDLFVSVPRLLEKVHNGLISKGKDLTGLKRRIYFWAFNLSRNFYYTKRQGFYFKIKRKIADKLIYSKWREALGGNVKLIVSGGAALQPHIAQVFGIAGIQVGEGYGMTESSPVISVCNFVKQEMKIGTVGPVLEGVEVKIADDGEILCKGPNVMKGYYKEPKLTAEMIDKDGWLHTGDIGEYVDEIFLKITDRKKEIFKLSGGKYIAPQMIENKLKMSFFIEQAMVIGANEKFASSLIAPNFEYLHDWCSQHKIHFRTNEELLKKPEVITQFQKEVNRMNKTLGNFEEIKRFRLVSDEWTPQSGELSPTLKLRRNKIAAKYQQVIDEIYSVS